MLLLSGNRDILKRSLGIVIALLPLGYGLVRIGVGALLLAQTLGAINFPDLADAVAEVDVFIVARASYQLLPFSLEGYFLYIIAMGVLLSAGAAGDNCARLVGIHNARCIHRYARRSLY